MDNDVELRPATIEDADFLFELRNDMQTRAASHNTGEVQWNEHISWLENTLKNENRRLYIAEENGIPVGQVRDDYSDGEYELSWTVAPKARERGVGKRMVSELAKRISKPVRAEIKVGNVGSIKIAEHVGMKKDREDHGILHYKRPALK